MVKFISCTPARNWQWNGLENTADDSLALIIWDEAQPLIGSCRNKCALCATLPESRNVLYANRMGITMDHRQINNLWVNGLLQTFSALGLDATFAFRYHCRSEDPGFDLVAQDPGFTLPAGGS